jgi:hypothetical protein
VARPGPSRISPAVRHAPGSLCPWLLRRRLPRPRRTGNRLPSIVHPSQSWQRHRIPEPEPDRHLHQLRVLGGSNHSTIRGPSRRGGPSPSARSRSVAQQRSAPSQCVTSDISLTLRRGDGYLESCRRPATNRAMSTVQNNGGTTGGITGRAFGPAGPVTPAAGRRVWPRQPGRWSGRTEWHWSSSPGCGACHQKRTPSER